MVFSYFSTLMSQVHLCDGRDESEVFRAQRSTANLCLPVLSAEHVPELRFALPVWDGQFLWVGLPTAAIGAPAPRDSEPGNSGGLLEAETVFFCGQSWEHPALWHLHPQWLAVLAQVWGP